MRSLALSLLIGTFTATASALSLSVTATTVGHEFSPSASSTVDYILGDYWGAVAAPSFSTALSAESVFSLTVTAPDGYEFLVHSAPTSTGLILSFGMPLSIWIASGWNGGQRDFMPTTIAFSEYVGPKWYDDTTGVTIDQDGRALVTEGALWWLGRPEIRFKSVSISADLTSLNGKALPSATFKPDLGVGIKIQNVLAAGTRLDPGPAVVLVASVPEPSEAMLIAAGMAALSMMLGKYRGKTLKLNGW